MIILCQNYAHCVGDFNRLEIIKYVLLNVRSISEIICTFDLFRIPTYKCKLILKIL